MNLTKSIPSRRWPQRGAAQAETLVTSTQPPGEPCVAAHSTPRARYAAYSGPLYQVLRQSDGKTLDIVVVQPRTDVDACG
jgi:hypothetical protein